MLSIQIQYILFEIASEALIESKNIKKNQILAPDEPPATLFIKIIIIILDRS